MFSILAKNTFSNKLINQRFSINFFRVPCQNNNNNVLGNISSHTSLIATKKKFYKANHIFYLH